MSEHNETKVDCLALFEEAAAFFRDSKFTEAKACYEHILAKDVCNARALHGMGRIYYQEQDIEAALAYLQQALLEQPDYLNAYCILGKIQKQLGRLLAAKVSYLKAIEIEPEACEILCILGNICKDLNQYELSEQYLFKALTHEPSNSLAHYEYGCLHQKMKHYDIAIIYFTKAFELQPDYADAYVQLALIYLSQGRQREANIYLNKGLEFKPNSILIRTFLAFTLNYLPGVKPAEIYNVSTDWARLATNTLDIPITSCNNSLDPDKILRIGFVSPDFRSHPVGFFVQSFMMLHDIELFEVVCYSDVKGEDDLSQSLIESADKWRRVYGISDAKLAEMIRLDCIDILVDLAGHTKDSRLNVFIIKPAPIQITWAGYVGTTGLSTIDYLISDRFQSPEGAEEHTVERIIRMPDDYICYTPPDYAPAVAPLPALENGYITFGCFNNLAKITEDTIELWCDILKQVAGSKIFVKNPSFSDLSTVKRFVTIFESHGISADRIITEGQSSHPEMLARYSLLDIQLDTMPYSGGLTTLESIWMGVPVVTLPGELFSSRHSLTHLMNIGLADCVATSRNEYVAIACRMAGDIAKLSEMRLNMRDMMASSPVCDGFRFTDNLQVVFRNIWREWCEKSAMSFNDDNMEISYETDEYLGDHISYNDQGNRYSDDGNIDAAMNCYRQALDIKPGYVEAYFNMGQVLYKTGKLDDAVRFFKLVICLSPDFAEAYAALGNTLIKMGRPNEAHEVFEKASAFEKESLSKEVQHCSTLDVPSITVDVEHLEN